ncbi:MAG: Fe-S cluster assembly protein SufB, partial [Actinomycetota bacterium]|nr:Fe-S cluster assembly protein SufB [Actinomycetota bacterium]
MTDIAHPELEGLGTYEYGWHDPDAAGATAQRGLSEAVVRDISALKNEPEWMLNMRLKSLKLFGRKPMPTWGSDLSGIDFDNIKYFVRSTEKQATSWEELPDDIKNTYDRLGIPEAEKQRLVAGVAAQYECLAGDTRVWTAGRGLVPIKEVAAGDRVFAFDEEAGTFVVAPVKSAAQTDTRLTYHVQVGTRGFRATDNHPVLALEDARKPGRQRARYRRRWKTVGELQPGDFIAVPRALPDFGAPMQLAGTFGPSVTDADLMWLLGFFIGDGNTQSAGRTHRVQFAVISDDVEVRAEISRIVAEKFGLRVIDADDVRVVINSKALVEWLRDLGFGGTSLTKRIPAWVNDLPREQRLAFLGGYVDADGYVGPASSGSVILTSGNAELLSEAAGLAAVSGLRASRLYSCTSPHPFDSDRQVEGFRLHISGGFEALDCRNPRR